MSGSGGLGLCFLTSCFLASTACGGGIGGFNEVRLCVECMRTPIDCFGEISRRSSEVGGGLFGRGSSCKDFASGELVVPAKLLLLEGPVSASLAFT